MQDPLSPVAGRAAHPWVVLGQTTVRFGVGFVDPWPDWLALRDRAQEAEGLGFDAWWVPDHPVGAADCWVTLANVAHWTSRLRLGTSVACVPYRSPVLLARLAADVDRLSDGRLILGVGCGDSAREFAQLGLPFAGVRERQRALEEALHIIAGVWGDTPFTYEGRYYRAAETRVQPPAQRPHVPLLIAGGGERVTLRQVAQYADVCNFGAGAWTGGAASLDDVRRKLEALRRHCEALGRPYDAVLRSHIALPVVLAPTRAALEAKLDARPQVRANPSLIAGTPDEAIAAYRALVEAGMRYFIAGLWAGDGETLRLLGGEVMPALASA